MRPAVLPLRRRFAETPRYRVWAVPRPTGQRQRRVGRLRVFVFGPVPVEPPTRAFEPWSEASMRQWRSYKRAKAAAYRDHARKAIRLLTRTELGALRLDRDGVRFVAETHSQYDIFVSIKGKEPR